MKSKPVWGRGYDPEHNKSCVLLIEGDLCGFEFYDGPDPFPAPAYIECGIPVRELAAQFDDDCVNSSRLLTLHGPVWLALKLLWLKVNGLTIPFRETGIDRHFREFPTA